jgi:hypothetical protein
MGGIVGFYACIPLLHLTVGLLMISGDFPGFDHRFPRPIRRELENPRDRENDTKIDQGVNEPIDSPANNDFDRPADRRSDVGPPREFFRFIGIFFVCIASVFIIFGWTLAICTIFVGRNLVRRQRYIFCMVIAAIHCINIPFGTVLGVFTITVLTRPSVKELFQQAAVSPFALDSTTPQ